LESFLPLPLRSTIDQYTDQVHHTGQNPQAVARRYGFLDWPALEEFARAVNLDPSPILPFELAVDAVVTGDAASLQSLLQKHPELVHARSTRSSHATLLHYIAANGVEDYHQQSPPNAVEIAKLLLSAGAEPDALADMYGGKQTILNMLVSSDPPAKAGVTIPLIDTLLDFGADIELDSPLTTALAFRHLDSAEALVRRGARIDTLPKAAGLGRLAEAARLLPAAPPEARQRALALASQHGQTGVVQLLLDAGEDASRYNPPGNHPHSTPLHQAALGGHEPVVRLLLERGARLDLKDTVYHGTPRDWAVHAGQSEVAKLLERPT
jgi:ankyrin repeat protein